VAEQNPLGRYARGIAIAFEFTGSIVGGAILGWWIDRWLGTEPWLMLLWLALGLIAGFRGVIRAVQRADRAAEAAQGGRRGDA